MVAMARITRHARFNTCHSKVVEMLSLSLANPYSKHFIRLDSFLIVSAFSILSFSSVRLGWARAENIVQISHHPHNPF